MTTPRKRFRVLLVCTGNTCRSPLAEAALRDALGEDRGRVEVRSAGTSAMEGEPASEGSRRVAEADGFDLSSHRSHRLTREDVRDADLVLVMERHHRAAVEALGADRGRVQVIDEWPAPGDPGSPVSDPFGGSPEAYEECWRRIRMHVERIVPHVRESLRAGSS
jgi:protein-tyrosine-phosphatase